MSAASNRGSMRAALERSISPGLGACYRCRRPWKHPKMKRLGPRSWQQMDRLRFWGLIGVVEHLTPYEQGSSCFPLCEACWASLAPDERLPYYRRLWNVWLDGAIRYPERTTGDDYILELNDKWPRIERAVLSGL